MTIIITIPTSATLDTALFFNLADMPDIVYETNITAITAISLFIVCIIIHDRIVTLKPQSLMNVRLCTGAFKYGIP